MLQIRKIREFKPNGSERAHRFDASFDPDIVVDKLEDIVKKPESIVEKIPEAERFNVFYTQGHVPNDPLERKKRRWENQDAIYFDIDDIEVAPDGTIDTRYLDAISEAIGIHHSKLPILFSGGGIQFIIPLKNKIQNIAFFQKNKVFFSVLCSRLDDTLRKYGLKGHADRSAFAPNRLVRLPLTKNIKPERKEQRMAFWLSKGFEPQEFDLQKISGLPTIETKDQLTEKQLQYFKVDSAAVEAGCDFLRYVKENQVEVSEPEWYAALSIVGRLDNGKELVHEYSNLHPSYSEFETNRKTEHAMNASGPRTCENINDLWGKCSACKHFKKVPSPISIKGENFIATSHCGFHLMDKRGNLKPQYADLQKFYLKEIGYLNSNQIHYRWKRTHFEETPDVVLDAYAQENFHPPANNNMASEFRGLVKRTELMGTSFFTDSTYRKINLQNGVLDIDTLELTPHSMNHGFRSCLAFEYDEQASAPTFEKFMRDVTLSDESLQSILLEFMGYALSNDRCTAAKVLVLSGEGSNGKSTFLNILRALGGDGVTSLGVKDLMNPFHRQALDGALFNILEEMPAWAEKNFWEDIKGLATGSLVTASKKFKDIYQFENRAKLIFTCNNLPKNNDTSHGFFRRLLIAPFNATFSFDRGNIDTKIDRKIIESELPGVLNMALSAYHRLRENEYRFTRSGKVAEAIENYKKEIDSVRSWVDEHLQVLDDGILLFDLGDDSNPDAMWRSTEDPNEYGIPTPELRAHFKIWCEAEGLRSLGSREFGKRLIRVLKDSHATDGAVHTKRGKHCGKVSTIILRAKLTSNF